MIKKFYNTVNIDLSIAHDYTEIPVKGRNMYVEYCDGIVYIALESYDSDLIRLYRGMSIDFAALPVNKIYLINAAQSNKKLVIGFFDRGGFLSSPDSALNFNFQQKSVIDGRAYAITNLTNIPSGSSYSIYFKATVDTTISHFSVTTTDNVVTTVYKNPTYSGGTDLNPVCLNFIEVNDTSPTVKGGVTLSGGTPVMNFINNFDYTDGIFLPKDGALGVTVSNDLGTAIDYAFFIAYTI